MYDKIAINKATALKMFWDAGYDSEPQLRAANEALNTLTQPVSGYYYAADVSFLIDVFTFDPDRLPH